MIELTYWFVIEMHGHIFEIISLCYSNLFLFHRPYNIIIIFTMLKILNINICNNLDLLLSSFDCHINFTTYNSKKCSLLFFEIFYGTDLVNNK